MEKEYIYIVQSSESPSRCKIGKTNDLDKRLNDYNNMTGKSKDVIYKYLFTCEVKNMAQLEKAIKSQHSLFREAKNKEIYFYNPELFDKYVKFIKSHKMFVKEIFIKEEDKKQIVQIVLKTAPSLEERGLTKKGVMEKAKKIENDEFFTRKEDVEKEISMYPITIWKNKTVFCNCDDPVDRGDNNKTSPFAWYFLENFVRLGLKKLICTHYSGKVDLFNAGSKGYIFTKYGFREIDEKKEYPDNFSGSFDSDLSKKILKEDADIVCTNPPFSRAVDYWRLVIGSGKKFLIISNITNVKNDKYIPYFQNNKVWAGYNEVDWFLTPKRELTRAAGYWFTNLPIKKRPKYSRLKFLPLKEIPDKYKKHDDKKTLLVDNCYIPADYKRPFAVSVRPILNGLLEKGYKIVQEKQYRSHIGGKEVFARVLVQKMTIHYLNNI